MAWDFLSFRPMSGDMRCKGTGWFMRSMRQLFLQSCLPTKQSEGKVGGYDKGQGLCLVMTFLLLLLDTSVAFYILLSR